MTKVIVIIIGESLLRRPNKPMKLRKKTWWQRRLRLFKSWIEICGNWMYRIVGTIVMPDNWQWLDEILAPAFTSVIDDEQIKTVWKPTEPEPEQPTISPSILPTLFDNDLPEAFFPEDSFDLYFPVPYYGEPGDLNCGDQDVEE